MTLLDGERGYQELTEPWFSRDLEAALARMSAPDRGWLLGHVRDRFDTQELLTTSWEPGKEWGDTPFEALFNACRQDPTAAAKMMGLVYCMVAIEHPLLWGCHHCKLDDKEIAGRTYYRLPGT